MRRFMPMPVLLALAIVLAACNINPPPAPQVERTPALIAEAGSPSPVSEGSPLPTANAQPTRTSMPEPSPSSTAFVEPTATQAPTTTPEPTASPAPTQTETATRTPAPTATPVNPLTITYMREQTYPGSEIVIEQTLQAGSNYQRYLASYRSEGLKIYTLLTIPNDEKPATGWPAIIFNHGYIPPEQYRTTERYVAYVDAFARNGYIVFRPDYRGHGSSEGEASGGYGAPGYTIDVLNALASLKQHPDADPDRLGMWGHSMGGHLTLRAMVTSPDIKAGVIWAGVVATYPDIINNWRRPASAPPLNIPERVRRWRQDFLDTYGTPEENPAFWASISPSEYVTDLSGPVQLHHGTADVEVPLFFSQDLFARVQQTGIPVEYYEYARDNHNLSNNLGTALSRSVEFFDRYVKAGS